MIRRAPAGRGLTGRQRVTTAALEAELRIRLQQVVCHRIASRVVRSGHFVDGLPAPPLPYQLGLQPEQLASIVRPSTRSRRTVTLTDRGDSAPSIAAGCLSTLPRTVPTFLAGHTANAACTE